MNVLERHKAWALRNAVVIPTKFVSSMCSYAREGCCCSQSLKSEHRNTQSRPQSEFVGNEVEEYKESQAQQQRPARA